MVEKPPEANRIRRGYEKDRRELKKEIDSTSNRMRRLSDLYEEGRSLWMRGDFKRLSEALEKEGFRFFHEVSEKLVELRSEADILTHRLEKIEEALEKGIVCPRCDGAKIIMTEKRYERSEAGVISISKTQECPLCKGSGKLRLRCRA